MWVCLVVLIILSLSLLFSRLIITSLWVNFYLSCIGFTELLESVGLCLLTNWGSFLPLLLNKFSSGTLSFSSPPRSLLTCVLDLLVLSNQFLNLCIFLSTTSLDVIQIGEFMLTYSKSVNLHFLVSVIIFSNLKFPLVFLYSFCFLAETYCVSIDFTYVCSYFLECFYNICFRSQSQFQSMGLL